MDFKDKVYLFEGTVLQPDIDSQFSASSDLSSKTGVRIQFSLI